MIWWVLVWVVSAVPTGLLTVGYWRYEFGAAPKFLTAYLILLGPIGLLSAMLTLALTVGGWRSAVIYWRNGRKTKAEVRAAQWAPSPYPPAGLSVGQISQALLSSSRLSAQTFQRFNRAFVNVANTTEYREANRVEEIHTPEPVIGWRWWALDPLTMVLRGQVTDWESGAMTAEHQGSLFFNSYSEQPHLSSPHPGCLCGINALKPEAIAPYLDSGRDRLIVDVFGRVALTGVVDEYELGYRAEKAEILELVILSEAPLFTRWGDHLLDEMESRYGVRPTVQSRESWLAEMEVIHGYGKEDQEDSQRAGEDTGAGEGTSEGTSQNRVIVSGGYGICGNPSCFLCGTGR